MASPSPKGKFLLLAALIFLCQATAFSQSLRVVDKLSWQAEPVKIHTIKANGINVETGKKFRGEKDWFNGLTVSVQNMSNKAIARIEINLAFPRGANAPAEQATYVVTLVYGLDPADTDFASETAVMPRGIAELKILQANVPGIKEDLAKLQYPEEITNVRLTLSSVTFTDGSMWAGDEMLYPDPANPKQKINPRLQNGPTLERAARLFRSQKAMPAPLRALFSHAPAWVVQDPSTLPCNTVFVTTQTSSCGPSGAGCTLKTNIFDDNIELLGLRNARKQLSTTRCLKSDGTFCTETIISNFDRLPCGARIAGTCGGVPDFSTYPSGCATGFTVIGGICQRSLQFQSRCIYYDPETCTCPDGVDPSPIVIDVDHSGFSLTDASEGVPFNVLNDNVPLQLSWINAASTNSFLVLDRNGNGAIDSGEELFGNLTPQPPSNSPNGFVALAEYDKSANGGNGDGKIDQRDSIFSSLRLWRDLNHNGVSEASELRPLAGVLRAIDLTYKLSKRVDQYGNEFRYRAKVYDVNGVHGDRWAWDVFLKAQ